MNLSQLQNIMNKYFFLFLKREENACIYKMVLAIFEFLFRLQNRMFFFFFLKKVIKKWEEDRISKLHSNVLETRYWWAWVPSWALFLLSALDINTPNEEYSLRKEQFSVQLCSENQCIWSTLMAFLTNFATEFYHTVTCTVAELPVTLSWLHTARCNGLWKPPRSGRYFLFVRESLKY